MGELKEYVVCPMTGRLVVKLLKKDDGQCSEIHVMDFLMPGTFL